MADGNARNNDQNRNDIVRTSFRVKAPKNFKEGDDIDLYIRRFETYCKTSRIEEKERYDVFLSL